MSATTTVAPEAYTVTFGKTGLHLRCTKCEKKTSSNNNPMLKQVFEVFQAKPIKKADGDFVDINGIEFYTQQMLMPKSIKYINLQRSSLGLPPLKDSEVEQANAEEYLGTEGFAVCVARIESVLNEVTSEVVVNELTGKPFTKVVREILEWGGR